MGRTVRTVISVAFVMVCLWGAFVIPLGDKTFAEHVDAIGETPEATQLLDGARGTINPALEEAKDRILGEHVTAPTHIPEDPPLAPTDATAAEPFGNEADVDDGPAGIYASDGRRSSGRDGADARGRPSTGERPQLPGGR